MCVNTSPNVLGTLRLLRFMGIHNFFNHIPLCHCVTQGDNLKIQNVVRKKRKTSWNWRLEKDFFLGHLQPPRSKNSRQLSILILEFDDVTVKPSICVMWHIAKGELDWISKNMDWIFKTWICKRWICKRCICKRRICRRWLCKRWIGKTWIYRNIVRLFIYFFVCPILILIILLYIIFRLFYHIKFK